MERGHGWIDVRGDQLRDAVEVAKLIDPHDAELLRLEYLSSGELVLHALGKWHLRIVSEADDD